MFRALYSPPTVRIRCSLSVSLLSALLLSHFSSNAVALAQRQPDNSLNSREDCVRKYGHITYYGGSMTMSSGNDTTNVWCIHHVAPETDLIIQGGSNEFSYARDNLKMFIPMKTHISRLRVNIPGGTSGQGEPAPLRQMGQTFEHSLQPIGNDNGQVIWSITPNNEVGLKIWNATSCGPDGLDYTSQNDLAVNTTIHHSGMYRSGHTSYIRNTPGLAWTGPAHTLGCNYYAHITTQVVLLKPDAVEGRVTIPTQKLGTIKLQSANYGILAGHIDFDINLPAMTFTFNKRTCSYKGRTDQTVKMHKIGLGHFANGRNEVYGGETTISLHCPSQANVESYVTFTDNSNINNTTDILSLTRDSSARNIGLKIYVNDDTTATKFGPVHYNPGTENTRGQAITKQSYMRKVSNAHPNQELTHSLKLVAKYARLNNRPITPGTVKDEMMFTFSYY